MSSRSFAPGFWSTTGRPRISLSGVSLRVVASKGLLPGPFVITPPARPPPSDSSLLSGLLGAVSILAVRGSGVGRSSVRAPEARSPTSVASLQEDRQILVCSGGRTLPRAGRSKRQTASSGSGLAATLTTIGSLANNRIELTPLRAAAHTARWQGDPDSGGFLACSPIPWRPGRKGSCSVPG